MSNWFCVGAGGGRGRQEGGAGGGGGIPGIYGQSALKLLAVNICAGEFCVGAVCFAVCRQEPSAAGHWTAVKGRRPPCT